MAINEVDISYYCSLKDKCAYSNSVAMPVAFLLHHIHGIGKRGFAER